jgi:hypothetical protein
MLRKFAVVLRCAAALMLLGTLTAVSADDGAPFPNGFRDWFFVNSLTATANSPLFGNVAGVHHIYVNAKGLPILKANGPFPYPDGTIFADDVHEFSVKDGSSLEGAKSSRLHVFHLHSMRYPTAMSSFGSIDEGGNLVSQVRMDGGWIGRARLSGG